ncbi:MAG: hypothetical protein AB8B51_14925 [Sedimentitalea sp.]
MAMMWRWIGAVTAWTVLSLPVGAEDDRSLADLLRMDDVAKVLRDEGLVYANTLETDMLGGDAGSYYRDQIRRLYDAQNMADAMAQAIDRLSEAEATPSAAFFASPLGTRIVELELSGRVAMAEPDIEDMALEAFQSVRTAKTQRLALLRAFVEANDLIELNVAGALNSNYEFYRGLVDGGGLEMSENEITSQVWQDEEGLREDTENWVFSYLMMSYQPLSDSDLEAYVAYSKSDAGQALNTALFAGFDAMYRAISYALGRSVAQAMGASDL